MKLSEPLWQVSVTATPEEEAAVAALLERHLGQSAVTFADARRGTTRVTVYCPHSARDPRPRRAELLAELRSLRQHDIDPGPVRLTISLLPSRNWRESWKKHFRPFRIGKALLVRPTWSRCRPRAGESVIELDPGLSFGTGHHPTTRFCLEELAAFREDQPSGFLDLGTGSGLLAIAAAVLGYRPIEAIDVDPQAVRVAAANARRNHVRHRIQLRHQDLAQLPLPKHPAYALVCANLQADLLIREAGRIAGQVADSGRLVLAGILAKEMPAISSAYVRLGFRIARARTEGEWRSGCFVRAQSAALEIRSCVPG